MSVRGQGIGRDAFLALGGVQGRGGKVNPQASEDQRCASGDPWQEAVFGVSLAHR